MSAYVWLCAGMVGLAQAPAITRADMGIGRLRTGDDTTAVRRYLGAPEASDEVHWRYPRLVVHLSSGGQVNGFRVEGSRWATPRGIRVGSSRAQVMRAYGFREGRGNLSYELPSPTQSEPAHSRTTFGISFEIVNERVAVISIGSIGAVIVD